MSGGIFPPAEAGLGQPVPALRISGSYQSRNCHVHHFIGILCGRAKPVARVSR